MTRMMGRIDPRADVRQLDPIVRRLRAFAPLTDQDLEGIRSADRSERYVSGDELEDAGQTPRPRCLLSGWACRQRLLPDGRRQIFSFLLPGDVIGFGSRLERGGGCTTVALSSVEAVDARRMAEAAHSGAAPRLAVAIAAAEQFEHSLMLDHMVRLGRLSAYERVAHLLLELQQRLEVVGLGDRQRFPLPLTQEMMADALGLSIVHVNRTLQQLRRARLIELRSGVAILLQSEALADLCDYRSALAASNKAA